MMTYSSIDGLVRTPLGVLTEPAVASARALFDRIAPLVATGNYSDPQWRALLNEYLATVPRNVGSRRPTPSSIFPTVAALQQEHQLLDSLAGSLQVLAARRAQAEKGAAADAAAAGATRPRLFDVSIVPVVVGEQEDSSRPSTANTRAILPVPLTGKIFRNVRSLISATARGSHLATHRLALRRLYHLDIRSMSKAHAERGARLGNYMRLWHGTRAGNLLSIMRSGLQVPPASSPHVTGRMFGDGIYGSDCSTKALNYAVGAAPGQRNSSVGGDDDSCFAFLADFATGVVHEPPTSGCNLPAPGSHSSWARAHETGLLNDEMIVYDSAQVRPVFLAEFQRA